MLGQADAAGDAHTYHDRVMDHLGYARVFPGEKLPEASVAAGLSQVKRVSRDVEGVLAFQQRLRREKTRSRQIQFHLAAIRPAAAILLDRAPVVTGLQGDIEAAVGEKVASVLARNIATAAAVGRAARQR